MEGKKWRDDGESNGESESESNNDTNKSTGLFAGIKVLSYHHFVSY